MDGPFGSPKASNPKKIGATKLRFIRGPGGPPSTGRLAPTACFPDRQRVHCLPSFGAAGAGPRPAVHPPSPLHVKRQFKTGVPGTSTIWPTSAGSLAADCVHRAVWPVCMFRGALCMEQQPGEPVREKEGGRCNGTYVRLAFAIGDRRATPTVDPVVDLPDLT